MHLDSLNLGQTTVKYGQTGFKYLWKYARIVEVSNNFLSYLTHRTLKSTLGGLKGSRQETGFQLDDEQYCQNIFVLQYSILTVAILVLRFKDND